MTSKVSKATLQEVLAWAKEKTHEGNEPPWAWYQYMKLVETIESILKGIEATNSKVSLQQSESHPGNVLRLLVPTYQQDIVQPHQEDEVPQLPM
jgi:hypothetical protein